jgi:hypothetical protein
MMCIVMIVGTCVVIMSIIVVLDTIRGVSQVGWRDVSEVRGDLGNGETFRAFRVLYEL